MVNPAHTSEFDRFQVLSSDCYGTLIDWEAGIRTALRRWADRRGVTATPDELLNLFATFETRIEQESDPAPLHPEVLERTLRSIGSAVGGTVEDSDAATFGASVGDWPAFEDSAEALLRLQKRYRLIIVSNIDRASFAKSNRRLGVTFDRIITAEEVGAYKPEETHFNALLAEIRSWGLEVDQLLHVAQSLFHDHEPAHRAGLATVWIDRRHDQAGYGATPAPRDAAVTPNWRFPSMATFAEAALPDLRQKPTHIER
jgi:2-haloalkanoic acid dehalogenase type II